MIKSALQYIIGLGKPEIIEVNGQQYSTKGLEHITLPAPAHLEISTLTGLVDYIKSDIDLNSSDSLLVQVCSPTSVKVLSRLMGDATRILFISCNALTPNISLNRFVDQENFIIMLQSCFEQTENTATIFKVVGNIKEENIIQSGDDGISQEVTAKVGIAKVANITVPNPVILAPYRTFEEVDQPESKFILRMKDGPQIALFEADGGAWRHHAMLNIKNYLTEKLKDCNVEIIA